MVGLESMQGMQREFQTICLTKLSNTCRQTQVQAGGEQSEPPQWRIQTGFHSFRGNPLLADLKYEHFIQWLLFSVVHTS